ncbi:hypothetical protein Vafri_15427 [Volvox africanus]|uniref:Uncharacterized protein n=1 Tax=Volvox africanus TaxID=51714 RepID=A0A8J4F5I9_9CHLO|nr:hypothetical protein Vafri_15427 [Volvox africanus]
MLPPSVSPPAELRYPNPFCRRAPSPPVHVALSLSLPLITAAHCFPRISPLLLPASLLQHLRRSHHGGGRGVVRLQRRLEDVVHIRIPQYSRVHVFQQHLLTAEHQAATLLSQQPGVGRAELPPSLPLSPCPQPLLIRTSCKVPGEPTPASMGSSFSPTAKTRTPEPSRMGINCTTKWV